MQRIEGNSRELIIRVSWLMGHVGHGSPIVTHCQLGLEWDLSGRRPASDRRWQSWARYAGAAPASDWCTSPATLNATHWWTGSQCSCRNTGVMWSLRRVPVTRRAAAFCTDWSVEVVRHWYHKAVSYNSPGDTRWMPGQESWWRSWTANGLQVWAGIADCTRRDRWLWRGLPDVLDVLVSNDWWMSCWVVKVISFSIHGNWSVLLNYNTCITIICSIH